MLFDLVKGSRGIEDSPVYGFSIVDRSECNLTFEPAPARRDACKSSRLVKEKITRDSHMLC